MLAALKVFFPSEPARILDIGAGDGEFGLMIRDAMPFLSLSGVDVIDRGESFIPITLYDGRHLPFDDAAFDYAILINMLHHAEQPLAIVSEAARVSRKGIIIKDHYADNRLDYFTLWAMEHLNPNAGPLLNMPLRFYSSSEWDAIFRSAGLECEMLNSRFISYGRYWDILFGRKMHFIGKYTSSRHVP